MNSNLQGLQGLSQQKAAFSTSVKMPKEDAIPVRTTDLKHLKGISDEFRMAMVN